MKERIGTPCTSYGAVRASSNRMKSIPAGLINYRSGRRNKGEFLQKSCWNFATGIRAGCRYTGHCFKLVHAWNANSYDLTRRGREK